VFSKSVLKNYCQSLIRVEKAWRQKGEENVCYEGVAFLDSGELRGIFRPKREEVTEDRRKLHSEGLYDMY
jgi:hypothetical protein